MSEESPVIDRPAHARFQKKLKGMKVGDVVFYWKAGNRGGPNPIPMTVFKICGGYALQLVGNTMAGHLAVDGAVHWKDKLLETYPDRVATSSTWAFRDEIKKS
jgi:hypothetical protein